MQLSINAIILTCERLESIAEENARCIILTAIVQHAGYKKSPSLGFILLSVFFDFTLKQCTDVSLSCVICNNLCNILLRFTCLMCSCLPIATKQEVETQTPPYAALFCV